MSQDALDFVKDTVGLFGPYHEQHGFLIDMKVWDAVVKYTAWCQEENTDFLFHVDMITKGDLAYIALATAKMKAFMEAAEACKN